MTIEQAIKKGSARRLAWSLSLQGRYAEAEQMSRDVVRVSSQALGPDGRITLGAKSDLAWILDMGARLQEAESLCREVLQRQQLVLGKDDADSWSLRGVWPQFSATKDTTERRSKLFR